MDTGKTQIPKIVTVLNAANNPYTNPESLFLCMIIAHIVEQKWR